MDEVQKPLKGKIAVVTGASSGIGRAIALAFGEAGAHVALLARRKERLLDVRQKLLNLGSNAAAYVCDLQDVESLRKAFKEIRDALGDPHILVNNAGTGRPGTFVESTLADYETVFNLNVRALCMACREVLPAMVRRKYGVIINIASIAGKMGLKNAVLYCASKFAVVGFSEALLEEVREENIRVSVLCPGLVDTEFFDRSGVEGDRRNFIRPEDVARAALLCALDTGTATFKEIVIRPRRPVA